MKVFISHQSIDTPLAAQISARLQRVHGIDTYLDVIDPFMNGTGEDLADHIRKELGRCTQLLAVISNNTASSQWVPWEVGVAAEKDYPLATYSGSYTPPPEFLRRWPYLRSELDLDRYASASKTARSSQIHRRGYMSDSEARKNTTRDFYRTLRSSLGQ